MAGTNDVMAQSAPLASPGLRRIATPSYLVSLRRRQPRICLESEHGDHDDSREQPEEARRPIE